MNPEVLSISQDQSSLLTGGMLLKSVFGSVFFWASNQSKTVLSTGSPLWASAQSFTCIWTNMHPMATQTSCSTLNYGGVINFCPMGGSQGYSIEDGSHCVRVKAGSNLAQHICHSVIMSLWYSNWKLDLARSPTHW